MDDYWSAIGVMATIVVLAVGLLGLYIRYLILQHVWTCPWPERLSKRLDELEGKVRRLEIDERKKP